MIQASYRKTHRVFYPRAEIKDSNVAIDGRNIFDQPVKTLVWTYWNIRKISGNVNEVIRSVLNFFFFFTKRFFMHQKYQKHQKHKDATKQKQKTLQANKN